MMPGIQEQWGHVVHSGHLQNGLSVTITGDKTYTPQWRFTGTLPPVFAALNSALSGGREERSIWPVSRRASHLKA